MESLTISKELEFYPRSDGHMTVFQKKSRRTFELGRKEAQVLRLFDGTRTAEEISESCPFYSREELEQLTGIFREMCFFDSPDVERRFSIWKQQVRLFNPNRLIAERSKLTDVSMKILFLLCPLLLAAGAACLLAGRMGILSFGVDASDLIAYGRNLRIADVAFLLFLSFCCLGIHELAHAVVARHYGVSVPEIGIMLYLLIPTAYTNVSGLWLLEKDREKLAVLAAGVMSNFGLIGGCSLLLFVVPGTAWKITLFLVIAVNAASVLMNCMIFLKYDAYYMMEVLLQEPGLKENAVEHVKQCAAALLPGNREARNTMRRQMKENPDQAAGHVFYCLYFLASVAAVPFFAVNGLLGLLL